MGGVAPAQVGNGGGGGSFVATDSNQAMLIAGGGGGTGHNTHGSGYGQIDGHTSEHGGSGEYCGAGSGGSLGAGGEAASNCGGGVGNAGGGGGMGPYHVQDTDEFLRVLHLNVLGTMLCVKHTVPRMLEAGGGSFAVKTGAEGIHVAAVPSLRLGIAIKIDDGARRAAEVAMAALLQHLDVLDDGARAALSPYLDAPVLNNAGLRVGTIRTAAGWPA